MCFGVGWICCRFVWLDLGLPLSRIGLEYLIAPLHFLPAMNKYRQTRNRVKIEFMIFVGSGLE